MVNTFYPIENNAITNKLRSTIKQDKNHMNKKKITWTSKKSHEQQFKPIKLFGMLAYLETV